MRGDRDDRADLLDHVEERERSLFELELAGLDLREVEDLVDHRDQGVTRRPHGVCVLALLVGQGRVEQQPAHPDHAVERRADLVAHVRDELGLHARGLDGLLVRTLQLFLGELVLSEIREREADNALEVHVESPGADSHGDRAVLGADQLDLDRAPGSGSPAQALELGVMAFHDE